jgi:hypothetical protein
LNQSNHFFDLGYGWLCKHCSAADAEATQHPEAGSGFLRHQDAEARQTNPPGLALATWTDSSRHALTCPRCGIQETISA